MKNYRFVSCFEVVRENDTYVIYCFIECGYHTLLIIWHVFYYFLVNTQFSNAQVQDVNEKNSESHLILFQNFKKAEIGWSKKWSGQAPLIKEVLMELLQNVHCCSHCLMIENWNLDMEALHVTYDTVSMTNCLNAFKRSMITAPTLLFVSLIMKSLLSL